MNENRYDRRVKGDKPVLAICYDFDKTLSPENMQAQGYIQSVGFTDENSFWTQSNERAEANDMDQNLSYMLKMKEEAAGKRVFTKRELLKSGKKIEFFPGVEEWFARIKDYGKKKGVIVEHYVISSGLKEIIEGTSIAKNGAFEKIYASSFVYNSSGEAIWPAQVVNYTNKTQFLFRISKGVLNINDPGVNDSFKPEDIRIPFRNIVYIGDSETDVPCMKLVNSYGGHSIGVFDPIKRDKSKVYKMLQDRRIRYFAAADYSEGKEMDKLVKAIIDKTATDAALEKIYFECKSRTEEAYRSADEGQRKKTDLINALESSLNFSRTHEIVEKLQGYDDFSEVERERLFEIAVENKQVYFILSDSDLTKFFGALLARCDSLGENALKVKKKMNIS